MSTADLRGGSFYIVSLVDGRKFGGWWDKNLKKFYACGTSGFCAHPDSVLSAKHCKWKDACKLGEPTP